MWVTMLIRRGSLHVTSARLPARFWTMRCAAVLIFSSSPSIAKSFIVSSRVEMPAIVTERSTTGAMISRTARSMATKTRRLRALLLAKRGIWGLKVMWLGRLWSAAEMVSARWGGRIVRKQNTQTHEHDEKLTLERKRVPRLVAAEHKRGGLRPSLLVRERMNARGREAPTERLLLDLGVGGQAEIGRRSLLGSVPEEVGRFDVLEVDVERLAEDLDLELEVELEFGKLVELDEEAEDGHEPGVGGLEDARL